MSTLSVKLRYRPLRIGWCVASDDFAGFREALRSTFTMWGGRFNPIIPADDPKFADELIRLFRIDALVPVSQGAEALVERYKHLPWPTFDRDLFVDHGNGRIATSIVDLIHPIVRIYDDDFKHNPNPKPCIDLYEWDEADPLADVFLSTYGAVVPEEICGTDYAGLARLHLMGARKIIANGAEIPPLDVSRMSIAGLGRAFIERHYVVHNNWDYPGFYVGDAGNLEDLFNFWNLRAADIPLQFYDPVHAARLEPLKGFWAEVVPTIPRTSHGPMKVAAWHRRALDNLDLSPFGEGVIDCAVDMPLWNGLNVRPPVMYFDERSTLAAVSTAEGKSAVSFALTNKPFVEDRLNGTQHFVLSVDPGIGLFGNETETLQTPFIPALNEFYGRNCYFGLNEARAEPGSLGLILSTTTDDVSLRGMNVGQLISEIFRMVGIAAAPSKAGLVGTSLIRQMGGLSGCRAFKIAGVRSLIENNRPDQSFSRSTAMQTIRGEGTARPLSRYQWLYIGPRNGQELKNDAVLSYLLEKGVFRAGLRFDCPSCQLEFWRSLDDAASRVECDYCGHHFNATSQLRDRDWAFRRSGLFGRDDHQEGAIPVTLTLQQLSRVHRFDHSIFTTAMALRPAGAAIHQCETDFVMSPRNLAIIGFR